MFRINRNSLFRYTSETTETPKQTVSKQTEKIEKITEKTEKNEKKTKKKRKNHTFSVKIAKYAPYQTVSVGLLFVSVQSKHRNSLFRYRSETTETNLFVSDSAETSFGSSFGCFESKLVSKDTLYVRQ